MGAVLAILLLVVVLVAIGLITGPANRRLRKGALRALRGGAEKD